MTNTTTTIHTNRFLSTQQPKRTLLNKIGNIHRHFINLRAVVLLDISQNANILVRHKVDRHSLASETTRPTDSDHHLIPSTPPVNIQFSTVRQVVVDYQGDLLHIESSTPHVGGDQHATVARSELLHDLIALILRH